MFEVVVWCEIGGDEGSSRNYNGGSDSDFSTK